MEEDKLPIRFLVEEVEGVEEKEGAPHSNGKDDLESQTEKAQLRQVLHHLGERVKELTALHSTARLLQNDSPSTVELLQQMVGLLPPAWQYPEITAGRIRIADLEVASPNYVPTPWRQQAEFTYAEGTAGFIEVVYLEERPQAVEGPFLAEERHLINSLADMLKLHFIRKETEGALRKLSKVFMDATDPIVIEDLSGRVVNLKPEAERAYNRSLAICYDDVQPVEGEIFYPLL